MSEKSQTSWAGIFALIGKLLKVFKSTKVLLAGLSVASYGLLLSWQFAFVLMAGLVLHEYGHLRAMQRCGHKTKGIYLIPFVGGAAVTESGFKTRWEEVYIAMMGPMWGLGVAILFLIAYYLTGWELMIAGAAFTALMNAFNMLPVNPLDGGRVFKCLSFSIHHGVGFLMFVIGCVIASVAMFKFGMALFGLILAISILDFWGEWGDHKKERKKVEEWQLSIQRQKNALEQIQKIPDGATTYPAKEHSLQRTQSEIDYLLSTKPTIKPDLSKKEMVFSTAWYTFLLLAFAGVMWAAASTGIDVANIPATMMNS